MVASRMAPAGDLAHYPGVCPDLPGLWEEEWNQRPFDVQAGTQSTEPRQPGPMLLSLEMKSVAVKNKCLTSKPYVEIDVRSTYCLKQTHREMSGAHPGPGPVLVTGLVGTQAQAPHSRQGGERSTQQPVRCQCQRLYGKMKLREGTEGDEGTI